MRFAQDAGPDQAGGTSHVRRDEGPRHARFAFHCRNRRGPSSVTGDEIARRRVHHPTSTKGLMFGSVPNAPDPGRALPGNHPQPDAADTGAADESTESFGPDRAETRERAHKVAQRAEIETPRRKAMLEVVARTGDRRQKGRHPKMAAFDVTRRQDSFATGGRSGGGRI